MNQEIAGSSPARIDRVLCDKDLDGLVGVLVRNVIHYVPVFFPTITYRYIMYFIMY